MKHLIFLLILITSSVWAKNSRIELNRMDGTKIIAVLSVPDPSKIFSVFIHFQGSSCMDPVSEELSAELLAKNIATLIVQKPGLSYPLKESECAGEKYLTQNNIFNRVKDAEEVLKFVLKKFGHWNKQLYIFGRSEGTVVATLLSQKVKANLLILFAGANGMTMEEEMYTLIKKGEKVCGEKDKEKLKLQIERVFNKSVPTDLWCSGSSSPNSNQWWSKILRLDVTGELLKVSYPIYIAHGRLDDMVPVESSYELVKDFERYGKKNFTFKEYPELNHKWRDPKGVKHYEEVIFDMNEWMKKNI